MLVDIVRCDDGRHQACSTRYPNVPSERFIKAMSGVSPLYPDTPSASGYPLQASISVALAVVPDAYRNHLVTNLPAPVAFTQTNGLNIVFLYFISYLEGSFLGDYTEFFIALPTTHGIYSPFIYVDADATMGAGREISGIAKKLAIFDETVVQFSNHTLRRREFSMYRRSGVSPMFPRSTEVLHKRSLPLLLDMKFTTTATLTLAQFQQTGLALEIGYMLGHRIVPSHVGSYQTSLNQLVITPMAFSDYSKITAGTLDVKLFGGPDDPFQTCDISVLGAYSFQCQVMWNMAAATKIDLA
jgi:hypothetical protein